MRIEFTPVRITPDIVNFKENFYKGTDIEHNSYFMFDYLNELDSVVSFIIPSGGNEVFYHYKPHFSPNNVASLIRGNITKFCIQERGEYCLHASSICVNEKVILFIGEKGAGKSTLASYFHVRGHEIWCDDYSLLKQDKEKFLCTQGDTSLKINPDIVTALEISSDHLKPVFELPSNHSGNEAAEFMTQKLYFSKSAPDKKINSKEVAAVFFIQKREQHPLIMIDAIQKSEAFSTLMQEILLSGINSPQYLKTYFQSSVDLLELLPSYAIHAPNQINKLNLVYDSILDTLNS